MIDRYPTVNGIAVSPDELNLPTTHYPDKRKNRSNHHAHFSARKFAQSVATQALRDLERHQFTLPNDVHKWLHSTYDPPELPTEEQAVKEVIDAYEKGERFKKYDRFSKSYDYEGIPLDLVDGFIAEYGLHKIISIAAD